MAFEVEEQFKRMDYIHDIESASVSGFIKGFADSYRTELANNGLDKSTVRQKAIGGLCQLGFEKNEVNEIIRLEPGEWDTIAQMYPVDMEWRKTYCDKIYKSALDGCNKFERKHPGYFNIIKYNIGGRHNKKNIESRRSVNMVLRQKPVSTVIRAMTKSRDEEADLQKSPPQQIVDGRGYMHLRCL